MKVYKLDKIVPTNTELTMEPYRAYVIEAWGTNDTAEVTAYIDAKKVGSILANLAPLRKTTSNLGGPLPLGQNYLVVPPDKTYKFTGTSAKLVHIMGKIVELAVGESLPADYLSRFGSQHMEYVTCLEGSTVGTGTNFADGAEVTLKSLTPSTVEQYTFNSRMYVNQVAAGSDAEAEGDLGVRFYLDGVPFDILKSGTGKRGIARMSMEIPDTATYGKAFEPFTLEDNPIVVPGDKTFEVKLMNVSGDKLFSSTQAQFRWYGVAVYRKV